MTPSDVSTVRKLTTWSGPFGVFLSHGIAFCVLYFVLAIFVQSLKFHYEIDNVSLTPVFARINVLSEHVVYYSLISIGVIFTDALIIAMIAKYGSRWLLAYFKVEYKDTLHPLKEATSWFADKKYKSAESAASSKASHLPEHYTFALALDCMKS